MIKKFQNKNFNFTNSYLYIKDNKEAILIDTATSEDKIINYCINNNIKIKYVLLTHNHLDHLMGLEKIIEKFNPVIYINKKDQEGLFDANINRSALSNLNWQLDKKQKNIITFVGDKEEELKLLGIDIKIIPFGGHTKGSTFYLFNKKDIFIGDTIFLKSVGMHRKEIGTDLDRFFESIRFLYDLCKKNNYVIYPGHYNSQFKIKNIDLNINLELKETLN
ncbi:MBL fold metallo-hydrolase [Candidatus Hepatoplasma crinochetorum]|uniref:MBL fold metallo-hydrolase n=1 Tax=Candidatus Hepatoplasma crinochetorum TaxID=295596 RepID=UPI0030902831|nr:MAG: Zn-dependent hydrolase/glyoxylase [Candidatus Hepatoplasma crinochetorum]